MLEEISATRCVRLHAYAFCEDSYTADTRRSVSEVQIASECHEATVKTMWTRHPKPEHADATTPETGAPAGALAEFRPPNERDGTL